MNIALLTTGFLGKKEATVITVTDFAQELMKKKHTVVVISEKREERVRSERHESIPIYRIGFGQKSFSIYNRIFAHPLAIRKMKKIYGPFNIIHNFSAAPLVALRLLFSKMVNPQAKTIQTLKSYSREKIGNHFYRVLNVADVVTVPTFIFAQKLISKGVKKEKIKIIYSHINTKKYFPQNKEALKKRYQLLGKKVVLYYGSMWENKGTDLLIQALPTIFRQNPNLLVIFIPRNLPYALRYQESLQPFGKKVLMIETEVHLPEYVAMADVVVLPYITLVGTEGNPSCLLETMACKTPVVTTALPEIEEIAKDCVIMAKPGDVASLAEAVSTAIDNYPSKMIEKAYRQAQHFSVETIAQEFLKIYQEH